MAKGGLIFLSHATISILCQGVAMFGLLILIACCVPAAIILAGHWFPWPTVLDDEDLTTATHDLATMRRALELAREYIGARRQNPGAE